MPQQSNESSAMLKGLYYFSSPIGASDPDFGKGDIRNIDGDLIVSWVKKEHAELIIKTLNAYDENQATIEKQRAVIKDLITASKMALKVLDGLPFKKNFDARNYIENVLNAIPEELL